MTTLMHQCGLLAKKINELNSFDSSVSFTVFQIESAYCLQTEKRFILVVYITITGVFWIDYESVKKYYDVIYINWNPDLFSHTTCMHQ